MSLIYSPSLSALTCSPTVLSPTGFDLLGGGKFVLQILAQGDSALMAYARSLFGLNGSVSPLAPMISVLKMINAMVRLLRGVATVNPSEIAGGLTDLGVATADLANFVNFAASLARTALAIRSSLVGFLTELRAVVVTLQSRYTNVDAMIAAATSSGNAAWLANAQCAKERLDYKVSQLNAMLAALGVAIQLFTVIICLVTGGEMGALPTLSSSNLVTDAIDAAIAALNAINIPDAPGVSLAC